MEPLGIFVMGVMVGVAGVTLVEQWRSGVLSLRSHGNEDVRLYPVGHPYRAHCSQCDQCATCGRLAGESHDTA